MAQQSSSRLNRLLTLLDTGSTQATRFAAARQIGDIAKSHPQDLKSLLRKVSQYLHSKNWDTRVAAAHAIGAIAENVKHTSLEELFACVEPKMSEAGIITTVEDVVAWPNSHPNFIDGLSFRSFNIIKVLEFGALLASGGQEYDVAVDNFTNNAKERLVRQKHNLRRRLGLDLCESIMDVNDMIKDEDLIAHRLNSYSNEDHRYYTSQAPRNIRHLVANMVPGYVSKRPSAREINLLKRKARVNTKDQTKGWPEEGEPELSNPENKSLKDLSPRSLSSNKVFVDTALEDNAENIGIGQWPFHNFVEQLLLDIFDPVWDVRHGSAMALREILSFQGSSAGVILPDLSLYNAPGVEFNNKGCLDIAAKTEIEIDLNVQVPLEDLEPKLKRPKFEDVSSSKMNTMGSEVNDDNYDIYKNVDVNGCNLHAREAIINAVKVECEPFPNNIVSFEESPRAKKFLCGEVHTAESRSYCVDKISNGKMDMLNNLAEDSELMNLVKFVRHSWLKNCEFLQDCAIRFLCVLSLDRFGDYVSDQVVAPVRETCAQSLGTALKYMHPRLVHETLKILLQMQHRPEWEIRHGSLLGIKYLVAVRQELIHDMLSSVLPACKAGLEDPDDDVRAVAADALIPAAAAIVSLNNQTLHSIVMLLWDILLDLDDLSPSTSSVMNLLAEIYSHEDMVPKMLNPEMSKHDHKLDLNEGAYVEEERSTSQGNPFILSTLAPRLWPFMRHSITSVRYSAIRTLERLLEARYRRNMSASSPTSFWPSFILGDTLRIVFQNLLLESDERILQCSDRAWIFLLQCPVYDLEACALSYMLSWIELAATPFGSSLDATKMYWPAVLPRKSHYRAAAKMKAVKLENNSVTNIISDSSREGLLQDRSGDSSNLVKIIVGADVDKSVTHTRVVTATALGIFASKLPDRSLQCIFDPLWKDLTSLSGIQRQVASMILISWFKEIKKIGHPGMNEIMLGFVSHLKNWSLDLLACTDPASPTKGTLLPYAELSRTYGKMHTEASQLFKDAEASGIFKNVLTNTRFDHDCWSIDDAFNLASKLTEQNFDDTTDKSLLKHITDNLETARQQLLATAGYLKCVQSNLHVTVSALVAAAVVWMSELPSKLNPIILPLMASIKREQEEVMQQLAAEALAELISHCIIRKPSPNDKLIKNLCSLACMDPSETPQAGVICSMEVIEDQDILSFGNYKGDNKTKTHVIVAGGEDRSRIEGFISRRGSELAFKHLCLKFDASLFEKLPKLWDCLTEVLKPFNLEQSTSADEMYRATAVECVQDPQILINNIQVVRCIAPMLDESLKSKLLTLLPCIFYCVQHSHVAVRLAASRCITSMAKAKMNVMEAVIEKSVPMLGDATSIHARQGAGMLVSLIVRGLGVDLVPYAPLLVIPLLRCMSDCDPIVRHSVTHSFAALVPLLPLAQGISPPSGLSEELSRSTEDARFLEQLLDNSHIDDYKLSIELKVTLRRYQQEGINWLSFLRRFKLHGILCDDMGLGKTLQASAILASDIVEHRASNNDKNPPLSLIVCPSTLVGHWAYEIEKYIDVSVITTLQYVGSVQDRSSSRECFDKYNVIITSYDVVRKDIDCLEKILWNYCILDEGHIIKNAKSKITSAVKQLKAQNRLILSGTPIQNNILDLWSLFDFLMPGFLGSEKQFQANYGKPLLAARDSKCSAKDAEAGVLAMEALHKQVMPFLLRRTKDEVLSDLPHKIIQDRYCDLSPVQLKLYEQFSGSHVRNEISNIIDVDGAEDAGERNTPHTEHLHVFQALQYLLKLCSHPLLVVGEKISDSLISFLSELVPNGSDINFELRKLHHSPKLVALQEILEECGIGLDPSCSEASIGSGQHRVLIFSQHKALLNIIERDLFQVHMKNVTYLRLDGSVEPGKRFDIVKSFNSDPTIDVLLLTTHVGGLGLNLTSADTLIFMEHDWNPMRDNQAMDRAHRLGQRKVVNVHRLIMRGTLEEKVMSLQRFKLSVANSVINVENASLKTMNTDQLLDLFRPAETGKKGNTSATKGGSGGVFVENAQAMGTKKGVKAILSGLEELWDQSQYTEEYNIGHFLAKLNG